MNPEELDRLSEQKSFARIVELEQDPVKGNFDASHLMEVHRRIFQDSPQHGPGELRPAVQNHIKNRCLESTPHRYWVHYAPNPEGELGSKLAQALDGWSNVAALSELSVAEFSGRMAYLYGNLDYLHPFQEGNSRTLRSFTRELAQAAGFKLSWGPSNADAQVRDKLYVARDLEVTERAFPGLDRNQAAMTPNKAEYDAWMQFASKYTAHERLASIIEASTSKITPLTQGAAPERVDNSEEVARVINALRKQEPATDTPVRQR